MFVTHSIYEAAFLGQSVLLLAAGRAGCARWCRSTCRARAAWRMRETPEFVALAGHLRRVLETC